MEVSKLEIKSDMLTKDIIFIKCIKIVYVDIKATVGRFCNSVHTV